MNSLISKFMAVWLHPWQAMENVKTQGYQENVGFFANINSSILFVFIMGLVSGIISAIGITLHPPVGPQPTKAMIVLTILLIPIISSFIASFFFWLIVNGILKGRVSEYGLTYHVVALITAFSPLAALLALIPGTLFLGLTVGGILAGLVNVWAAVVVVGGIIIVRETPFWRSVVTFAIIFVFLLIMGMSFRAMAQRQLAGGANYNDLGTSDLGGPTDDLGATSDNLEEQLKGMADKAKADQKTDQKPAPSTEQPKK